MPATESQSALKAYRALLFICCLITFGCYFSISMRLPVVPLYARTLGISTTQIGIFNAAFFLMAGLLSLPMGLVSDRTGSKPVAASGMVILALAAFSLYLCRTFPAFTLVYLLLGVGIAAFGPTMMSFVSHVSPRTHLGRSYGWYTTALFCGMSLGPAAGGFMAQRTGFGPVFITIGIILLAVLALLLARLPATGSENTAVSETRPHPPLKSLFRNRPLIACWVVTLGACFGLGMFISFIPLHAQNSGLDVKEIGLVFFVQGLFNGLSRIPFGHLSDQVARRQNLVIGGVLGFIAALAGFGFSSSLMHFIGFGILSGVSLGLAFTSVGALIAEVVPPESRGVAMGGYNTCIYFGMMASSAGMGGIIPALGFAGSFYLTALVNAGMLVAFMLLFRRQ